MEWSLLIYRCASRRLECEWHNIHALANDVSMSSGEAGDLRWRRLPAVDQSGPQVTHCIEKVGAC